MKKIVFCCLLLMVGCAKEWDRRRGETERSCTVTSDADGSKIVCADGTQARVFNGRDGRDGKDGVDGKDGRDGVDGKDGRDGVDGKDGQSCTVSQVPEGALVVCGGNSVVIVNGQNALLDVVVPCSDGTNRRDNLVHKEIILRMSNGKFYAYFEIGNNRFLSELGPGSYITTDGGACRFDIDNDGNYVMY